MADSEWEINQISVLLDNLALHRVRADPPKGGRDGWPWARAEAGPLSVAPHADKDLNLERQVLAHWLFYVGMSQRPLWLSQECSLNLCSFQPRTLLSVTRSKVRLSFLTQQHLGSPVGHIFFVTCVYVVCWWAGSEEAQEGMSVHGAVATGSCVMSVLIWTPGTDLRSSGTRLPMLVTTQPFPAPHQAFLKAY